MDCTHTPAAPYAVAYIAQAPVTYHTQRYAADRWACSAMRGDQLLINCGGTTKAKAERAAKDYIKSNPA